MGVISGYAPFASLRVTMGAGVTLGARVTNRRSDVTLSEAKGTIPPT
jgi:hypothetical protein